MSDDLQDLWQGQNPEPFRMPLEEIRRRAEKLQKRVRWRNVREYIACAVAMVVFFRWMWVLPNPIMRAGSILIEASMGYVVWQLYRRGSSREITGDCLDFHLRELKRQRDAVASVWRWYLGPMIPGLLVMMLGSLYHNHSARHTWFVAVYLVVCGAGFYWVGRLNQRAARCLERQIEELERLQE